MVEAIKHMKHLYNKDDSMCFTNYKYLKRYKQNYCLIVNTDFHDYIMQMIDSNITPFAFILNLACFGNDIYEFNPIKVNYYMVTSSQYFAQTEPLFKRLEILNLFDIYDLRILKFVYKVFHYNVPIYF